MKCPFGETEDVFLWAFIFVATFLFSSLLLIGSCKTVAFEPELKVKTPSAGFKLAKGLAPRPLPATARAAARQRGLPARSAPRPGRAGGSEPTSPPGAERRGALGRASRLRPAHAARLHFYGERTIAEVWRVAVCRRDNRGFLFIATLSTCRRVVWVGPRRTWGSRAARRVGVGPRATPAPLGVRPLHGRPCTRGPSVCNSAPLAAPGSSRRLPPSLRSQVRCAETRGSGARAPRAQLRIPFPGRHLQAVRKRSGHPRPHLHGRLGCWPRALRSPRGPGGSADPTPAARSWKPEEGLQNLPGKEHNKTGSYEQTVL
ncbi:uncharacterized protein LOC125084010 [Lutra lutra]|uniref:uncharacterized protein LOC125084010 n=1 Tax=Lutra lutra TaxID=9657 RepID=UPI001FD5F2E9|nr:uncharacterized protein LOC125084010 [Lutra lutra]